MAGIKIANGEELAKCRTRKAAHHELPRDQSLYEGASLEVRGRHGTLSAAAAMKNHAVHVDQCITLAGLVRGSTDRRGACRADWPLAFATSGFCKQRNKGVITLAVKDADGDAGVAP
jgi:hypothetical protein